MFLLGCINKMLYLCLTQKQKRMEFIKNGSPRMKMTMTDFKNSNEYTIKVLGKMTIGESVILQGYSLTRIK